jgi:hypothetical protein
MDGKESEARLRRFERLGGVDLSHLDREEQARVRSQVIVGIQPYKRAIFRFRCQFCGRVEENDCEMPPACTGPSWTDEHPLEPMELIR